MTLPSLPSPLPVPETDLVQQVAAALKKLGESEPLSVHEMGVVRSLGLAPKEAARHIRAMRLAARMKQVVDDETLKLMQAEARTPAREPGPRKRR